MLLLVCAWPMVLTVRFFSEVHAGLTELLPKDSPSVKALDLLHARIGSQARLMVIASGDDGAANRRFVLELGERVTAAKLPEVKQVQVGCHVACAWVRQHALLIMPPQKFDDAIRRAEHAIAQAKLKENPLYVELDDEAPPGDLKDLEAALGANDRFPEGFFETPGGKMVVALIDLQGSETEFEPSANLLAATQKEVAQIRARYPPQMVVAYAGEVAGMVEEHDAILADISLSTAFVLVLVAGVILVYFRSARALAAVLFALAPGLIFTFALGRIFVGHLNSNTAFLGSIIAGNGINFPLLYLAYYRARDRDEPRPLAIAGAAKAAWFGTLGAALCASAAYGALAVSSFRGFSQFGWIGGMGMIVTWLFTFLAMPIAIALFDPPRVQSASPTQAWLLGYFARPVLPRAIASGFALLALFGAGLGVRYASVHGIYETDLRALRNRDSFTHGTGFWETKMAAIFGSWLSPLAGVVDDPVARERLAATLRQRLIDDAPHVADRVETIEDLVRPPEDQLRRIERLKQLKAALANVPRAKIPEKLRPLLDAWLSDEGLRPVTLDAVPPVLKAGFREINGDTHRLVLVFPSMAIDYQDARNIVRFSDELQKIDTGGAVIGGGFMFMAEIIRLVHDEAPKVIIAVALLVALVLTPLLIRRPARILLVVGTVGSVALVAQANLLAVGVQLNMLDFAAVPITIGVGADYVVNLLGAMDALRVDARRACARMGGAIFLCSLTTMIGYASLLLAQSGALRTFGWAAVVGEAMASAAVLLVLPVVLAPAAEKISDPQGC